MSNNPFDCKKCGAKQGMGIEEMSTGQFTPLDICKDCLFAGTKYNPIVEQIVFDPTGGIIDGEVKDMAEHLNALQRKVIGNMEDNTPTEITRNDINRFTRLES